MSKLSDIDGKIIEIGNKDYRILLIDNMIRDSDELGNCQFGRSTINLDKHLLEMPEMLLEVLIHEIQHALNERFHLNKLKEEEEFTDQIAVAWATLFRRNRWLAEYILTVSRS